MYCSNCGVRLILKNTDKGCKGDVICVGCNKKLNINKRICKCGNLIKKSDNYCMKCGINLDEKFSVLYLAV